MNGLFISCHRLEGKAQLFFIKLAKKDMRKFMINLPDQDLAYLPEGTENFGDYVKAVHWAQSYAMTNLVVIQRFLDVRIAVAEVKRGLHRVWVG